MEKMLCIAFFDPNSQSYCCLGDKHKSNLKYLHVFKILRDVGLKKPDLPSGFHFQSFLKPLYDPYNVRDRPFKFRKDNLKEDKVNAFRLETTEAQLQLNCKLCN